jgi:flavin-binding protein dodecin
MTVSGETSEGPWSGSSRANVTDAIKDAVEKSDAADSSVLVVTRIEVTVEGDPHVGEYRVTVQPGG